MTSWFRKLVQALLRSGLICPPSSFAVLNYESMTLGLKDTLLNITFG